MHEGDENPIRTLGDYKASHEGYRNTIELPVGNNMDPSPHGRILLLISLLNSFYREGLGKLRDRNVKEFWALLEDLALYDNESSNDLRDFAKPVKAFALPQDVPNTSDCRLIKLENQVQCLMEAHLTPTQPTQVNKITTSCKICSGPHDTQYCMEDPDQAFVKYASLRIDEAGVLSLGLTNKLVCKKVLIKNEEEIFTDAGDGVRIIPDGVASLTM
nr:MAK10-like protein [Tanacetum cinerariifolium]